MGCYLGLRWQHRLKREHPTCTERNKIAHLECGWKGGDSGDSAGKKQAGRSQGDSFWYLLVMEGDYTQ